MRTLIYFIFTTASLFSCNAGFGQKIDSIYQNKSTYVEKGNFFINGSLSFLGRDNATQGYYRVTSGEIGVGYYILNGFALKAAITGQHLNSRGTTTSPIKELNQVNLFLASGQARCNFYVIPNAGSLFLQTSYSYGDLPNHINQDLWRWEILSFGQNINSTRSREPRLSLETKVALEKNNLSKVLMYSLSVGVNYFLRCESCNPRKVKGLPRLNDQYSD